MTSAAQAILPAAQERVTLQQLLWVSGCLALAVAAGAARLPGWVMATVVTVTALRLGYAARGGRGPPRILRLGVAGVAISLLFAQYHTFNGLTAGSALLTLVAGLKLLETETRRDLHVIAMIVYFLSLAMLLEGESFWLLSYLIGVCWLTTSTLLGLTGGGPRHGGWRRSLRHAGRLLAQAVPVALALWLLFPRLGGPLWSMPADGGGATSGLSDSMSPGDITELAMSDEIAFRVRFRGATPPAQQRYWRGPVLHDFDGHAWRRTESEPVAAPALRFSGPAYHYTVSLEPTQHHWLYVLDWPSQWEAHRAYLTLDYMLMAPEALSQPLDLVATSYGEAQAAGPLDPALRRRDSSLPPGRNPRSLQLVRSLRSAHPDDGDFVAAVLERFHTQDYYYTLTPPRLGADSVDDFLFDTKRGFCGHFASAFATLMRAGGIPARVVTGYQGGTYNRFADYWILRQSDAHAWTEVWIDGRGWRRVDPTAAIPPDHVDHGLDLSAAADASRGSRWQQRHRWFTDLRLRVDALRLLWRERILDYNATSQDQLLQWLHVPAPDGQKLALILTLSLIGGMAWLTWQVRRDLAVGPSDPVSRAYRRFCGRLAAIGLSRLPHEGPEAFAARVSRLRPDLAAEVTALCRTFAALRYGPATARSAAAAERFPADARRFRPRGSRASS